MTSPSDDGGEYKCVVSNAAGSGSDTANLYVQPTITSQPMSINTMDGNYVNLSCVADGFPMPTYRWEKEQNGRFTEVSGVINQTLTFDPIVFDDNGRYRCIATVVFPMGSISTATVTSTVATLTGKPHFHLQEI